MRLQNTTTCLAIRLRLAACTLALGVCAPALAQNIPSADAQEIIIKSSLMTFNDANLSGNYAVLHALGSKPLRDAFTPEKFAAAFKAFRDQQIDLGPVLIAKPVSTKPTLINEDGVMITEGYLDTPKMRVTYVIKTLPSDGKWKLLGINVDAVSPPK